MKSVLVPAAIGAGGAIALAVAYGYAAPQLPSTLTTGYFPLLVKAAGAIGLGMLASKFLGRQQGTYVTMGGLTVVLVSAITPMIQQAAPTLPGLSGLGGMNDYVPYARPGVGAYMQQPARLGRMGRLGFYSPAAVVRQPGMGAYMSRPVPGMRGLGAMSGADMAGGSGYDGLAS